LSGHCDRLLLDWCKDRRGPTSEVTDRKESDTLTRSELVAYIEKTKEVAPTRYAEIVTLAYTGMRAGELYGLEWRHIELEARVIRVEQSISRTGKIKCTKTGKTRRPPLSPIIAGALEEHRTWLMRTQNPGLHDGIVFPSMNGGRRLSASLRKPMLKIARACKLDINVGPQVLRKTFITLVGAAHNRELVKSITGHETDEMHEHYTHIRPETQYDAVLDFFGKEVG
jgi:integrase